MRRVMLLWHYHRRQYVIEQTRPAPGDVGRDGLADAGDDGLTAWLRDRETDRADQRESGSVEPGDDLRLAGPASASRIDFGEVGDVREQPEGEVLFNYKAGKQTACRRRRILAPAGGCDGPGVRRAHGGLKIMIS